MGAYHLAKQWLDIVDGEESGTAGFHDEADRTNDGDAARLGELTALILVQDETGAKLASEHNCLGFSCVQPENITEPGDRFSVGRRPYHQPRRLREVESPGADSGDLSMDGGRHQNLRTKRREQIKTAHTSKDDERAGVRDDQLVDRAFLNAIATSTCWRSSSSDMSKYGTSCA